MHPFTTVRGAITAAFVLAIVISLIITGVVAGGDAIGFHHPQLDRWLHIVAGVMWIGLLYYFNVVQTPGLAAAAADKGGPGGAGVSKYIAPRALVVVPLGRGRHLAHRRLLPAVRLWRHACAA